MPRIEYYKPRYMTKDFPSWLMKKARQAKKKQKDLADLLQITPAAFSRRLTQMEENGICEFGYTDLLQLFKEVNATDEEILKVMKL